MNAPTGTLTRLTLHAWPPARRLATPPFWLALALAAALGVALLAAFITTLQQGLRRGEEFRQWQRTAVTRKNLTTVANAVPGARTQPAGATFPANFQR